MTPISELLSLCKAEVLIEMNEGKNCYLSAADFLSENEDWKEETGEEIWQAMIEKNVVISIQAYPNTPVGFYRIYHYDIDKAIDKMIEVLKNNR